IVDRRHREHERVLHALAREAVRHGHGDRRGAVERAVAILGRGNRQLLVEAGAADADVLASFGTSVVLLDVAVIVSNPDPSTPTVNGSTSGPSSTVIWSVMS